MHFPEKFSIMHLSVRNFELKSVFVLEKRIGFYLQSCHWKRTTKWILYLNLLLQISWKCTSITWFFAWNEAYLILHDWHVSTKYLFLRPITVLPSVFLSYFQSLDIYYHFGSDFSWADLISSFQNKKSAVYLDAEKSCNRISWGLIEVLHLSRFDRSKFENKSHSDWSLIFRQALLKFI